MRSIVRTFPSRVAFEGGLRNLSVDLRLEVFSSRHCSYRTVCMIRLVTRAKCAIPDKETRLFVSFNRLKNKEKRKKEKAPTRPRCRRISSAYIYISLACHLGTGVFVRVRTHARARATKAFTPKFQPLYPRLFLRPHSVGCFGATLY